MPETYESETFFAYWRRRVENTRWLHEEQRERARLLDPEVHIVATAGLDALAK